MSPRAAPQARRSDARRNVERILDAAVEELARDPEASMAAVARRAGLVRATVYVHFPTREALVAAISERAVAEVTAAIDAAGPADGTPREALARLLAASWQTLGRYHAVVAINSRLGDDAQRALHAPVLERLRPILERGQARGDFNGDVPVEWLVTVTLELVHAASRELGAGRLPAETAEPALVATVLGALAPSA